MNKEGEKRSSDEAHVGLDISLIAKKNKTIIRSFFYYNPAFYIVFFY